MMRISWDNQTEETARTEGDVDINRAGDNTRLGRTGVWKPLRRYIDYQQDKSVLKTTA